MKHLLWLLAVEIALVVAACGRLADDKTTDAATADAAPVISDDGGSDDATLTEASAEAAAPSPLSGDLDAACPLGNWQTAAVLFVADGSVPSSIYGASADDVWAVGGANMMHFDGGAWSVANAPPVPDGGAYSSVWAGAADDAWAVAQGPVSYSLMESEVFHFDGGAWSSMTPPDGGAWLVSGRSGHVSLAQSGDETYWPQVFEYEAPDWVRLGTIPGDYRAISGFWADSPTDVWLGGAYFKATATFQPAAWHWDGTQWTKYDQGYPGPPHDQNQTGGSIWGSSASDVWFATQWGGVWHSNGAAPTIVPFSTNSSSQQEQFFAASGTSANDVWLAGDHVFHWDGSGWTCTSTPAGQTVISLWNSSPSDVWATTSAGVILHGP